MGWRGRRGGEGKGREKGRGMEEWRGREGKGGGEGKGRGEEKGQARIQDLTEGGAGRIARFARAKFLATTPTQQYSLTESKNVCNRQGWRQANSSYTN